MRPRERDDAWAELARTASIVRARPWQRTQEAWAREETSRRERTRRCCRASGATVAIAALAALVLTSGSSAAAGSSADSTLFSLTNQDRVSNGVRSLVSNGTLTTVGEGGTYGGCGFTVRGRAVDMIQRN